MLILLISASLELLLNRLASRFALTDESELNIYLRVLDWSGLFFYYFTSILACLIVAWSCYRFLRDQGFFHLPERIAFTILSAVFLPLAAMSIFSQVPARLAPHLNTIFGLLLVVLVIALLRSPASLRAKLGLIYLIVPVLLHGYWLLVQQVPTLAPANALAELPSRLYDVAEELVVVGGISVFLFFAPVPRLSNFFNLGPSLSALMVVIGFGVWSALDYLTVAQAAYYGFGLNLPPLFTQKMFHLAALFLFLLTINNLAQRPGVEREMALGLFLLGLSGFQLQLTFQLLLTLLGFFQLLLAVHTMGTARQALPRNEEEFFGDAKLS